MGSQQQAIIALQTTNWRIQQTEYVKVKLRVMMMSTEGPLEVYVIRGTAETFVKSEKITPDTTWGMSD